MDPLQKKKISGEKKIVLLLLSASVERFSVSYMQFFFMAVKKKETKEGVNIFLSEVKKIIIKWGGGSITTNIFFGGGGPMRVLELIM